MKVGQSHLYGPRQPGDSELLNVVASPALAGNVRSDHLTGDAGDPRVLVDGVLLVLAFVEWLVNLTLGSLLLVGSHCGLAPASDLPGST